MTNKQTKLTNHKATMIAEGAQEPDYPEQYIEAWQHHRLNCATTMLISAKWATESPFVCFLCVIRYVRTRVKKGFKKQVWVFSAMADAMSEAEADNWATVKQCAEGYTTVDMSPKVRIDRLQRRVDQRHCRSPKSARTCTSFY